MKSISQYTNIDEYLKVASNYSRYVIYLESIKRELSPIENNELLKAKQRYESAMESVKRCEADYDNYVNSLYASVKTPRQPQLYTYLYDEYTTRANMSDIMDAYNDYKFSICY